MNAPFEPSDHVFPSLPENGRLVLERRYLKRDADGNLMETPLDLFRRVARCVAEGDLTYGADTDAVMLLERQFFNLLANLEFLPNSPTLSNAARPYGQLSACFVLPVDDSIISIFDTLKHAAMIHQSGGGTGFSFSSLRPSGDPVAATHDVSAGPVAFMEVYNAAMEAIKQGGIRQGANMGVLRIDHPDVESFISAKDDLRKVTNFNISLAVTDAFMQALFSDEPFPLRHPNTGECVKWVQARDLFAKIVDCAWRTGEPGLIFIDEINRHNPTPAIGEIKATNPCGELPLLPYEACNLGSINLTRMLTEEKRFNWDKLASTVCLAMHFLDNVITQNRFPIPEIGDMVEGNRKIGLGVMGWADCLIEMGIPYDSQDALALAREVAAWIDYHSKLASVDLARQRGAFPNFDKSRFAESDWLLEKHGKYPTCQLTYKSWAFLSEQIARYGIRNATTTCVAPTGTISLLAGVSGGIEPVFALAFTRNVMNNTRLPEVQPAFAKWLASQPDLPEDFMTRLAQSGGIQEFDEIARAVRRLFVTSLDISPDWHVHMQAAFQEFTDNGVSKTTNFSESATHDAISETYQLAYRAGLKGITVYRNNSRQDQPMVLGADKNTSHRCPDCD